MNTIKAFNKNLICKNIQYEVGKIYYLPKNFYVKMCNIGFHASKNFDISDTVNYYPNIMNSEYAIVNMDPIDTINDKMVSNQISILYKLELKDCINYDKTGKWLYYATLQKVIDINIGLNKLLNVDKTGKWLYLFAKNIQNSETILNKLLEIDTNGLYLQLYALNIKFTQTILNKLYDIDTNGKFLSNIFIKYYDKIDYNEIIDKINEKDKNGEFLYKISKYVPQLDLNQIFTYIISKEENTLNYYYYLLFLKNIKGIKAKNFINQILTKGINYIYEFLIFNDFSDDDLTNIINSLIVKNISGIYAYGILINKEIKDDNLSYQLQQLALQNDIDGSVCFDIAKYASNPNYQLLETTLISKDETGELSLEFAKEIKNANKEILKQHIISIDETGELSLEFACIVGIDDDLINFILSKDKNGDIILKMSCECDLSNEKMYEIQENLKIQSIEIYNKFIKDCGEYTNENN